MKIALLFLHFIYFRSLKIRFGIFFLCVLFLTSSQSHAAIHLPSQMNQNDRKEVLRIIGFGTSGKILSDPYPLGGYSGFELAISVENLPTDDLSTLGSKLPSPQQDVLYPKLTIAKGLYDNLDFSIHFTPYNKDQQLSQFGGLFRWGFYQATFLPLSASLVVHVHTINVGNQMSSSCYGADLVGGINVNNVSLYAGLGSLRASGTFMGGPNGVTDSSDLARENVTGLHSLAGINVHLAQFFFAVELDRYSVSVFSAKAGVRF